MQEQLKSLLEQYNLKVSRAISLKELDEIFLSLFGKNGEITILPKGFKDLPKEELREVAPLFNRVKAELEKKISDKRQRKFMGHHRHCDPFGDGDVVFSGFGPCWLDSGRYPKRQDIAYRQQHWRWDRRHQCDVDRAFAHAHDFK
jgi:hypothetical protein